MIRGRDPRHADREAEGHQHAGGQQLSHSGGASGRKRFIACLAAVVALGTAAELASLPRADLAFLVWAAGRLLDGAQLYTDVVEVNPPLIVWLNLPAELLARALGISGILAYRVMTCALLVGALALADWSLRWGLDPPDRRFRRRIVVVLAAVLFLAAWDDFGQREHLLLALSLPYVLLAAARAAGRPAPALPAAAAGVLAGLGLALKPPFLLVWVALEFYAARRRRERRPSPEALGTAGFLVAYLGAVAVLTPQYFGLVRLLGSAYTRFGHYPFLEVLVTAPGTALCLLAVFASLALYREARHPELWRVFLLVLGASFLAGAVQLKGWGYHFYPARAAALTLLALAVLDVPRPLRRIVQQVYAAVAFGALATSVLSWVAIDARRVSRRDSAAQTERARLEALTSAVRRTAPPGGSLYVMSYTIESGFPLVNYSGLRWASRFPHLWIIEAVYQDRLYAPGPLRFNPRERMGAPERYLNDAVYQDLSRYRPDVLLVLRHARDLPRNAIRRVDYVDYFSRDPRIAALLGRYRLAEEVDQYLLYVRAPAGGQPGLRPAPEPGRYDLAHPAVPTGMGALAADRAFALSAALFLLLTLAAFTAERRRSPHLRSAVGE